MAATGLERNRVQEAVLALIKARLAVVAGAGAPSPKGGRPPARYALTPWALAQLPASGGSPREAAAARRGRGARSRRAAAARGARPAAERGAA